MPSFEPGHENAVNPRHTMLIRRTQTARAGRTRCRKMSTAPGSDARGVAADREFSKSLFPKPLLASILSMRSCPLRQSPKGSVRDGRRAALVVGEMEAQKELSKPRNTVQICTAWSTRFFNHSAPKRGTQLRSLGKHQRINLFRSCIRRRGETVRRHPHINHIPLGAHSNQHHHYLDKKNR